MQYNFIRMYIVVFVIVFEITRKHSFYDRDHFKFQLYIIDNQINPITLTNKQTNKQTNTLFFQEHHLTLFVCVVAASFSLPTQSS